MNKVVQIFSKETKYQNESDKIRLTLRMILVMSVFISIFELAVELIFMDAVGRIPTVIFLSLFVLLLISSYYAKSKPVIVITNVVWLFWIASQLRIFGWASGAWQIVILMSIIPICCYYARTRWKLLMVLGLYAYLLSVYLYVERLGTAVSPDHISSFLVFSCTSLCVFFTIVYIVYIFVKEERSEERKLVKYNIQLANQARTDALTGLFNRRYVLDALTKIYEENDPLGFCVAMCDVDFFKKVNDNYGHDVGDVVLKKVAETMRETIQDEDISARWGGEEFLLVFPKSNGDQAMNKLHEIQRKIRALEFNILDRSFKITMTMGLAEYDFESDVDTIIKAADEKMYSGKENGRDQIVF